MRVQLSCFVGRARVTSEHLADNFVAETSREKESEEDSIREERRSLHHISHVLDPVFKLLVADYVDECHFDQRMRQLWDHFISSAEQTKCEEPQREERVTRPPVELNKGQVCFGFNSLDFEATLHFSETDFDVITENGTATCLMGKERTFDVMTFVIVNQSVRARMHKHASVCVCEHR